MWGDSKNKKGMNWGTGMFGGVEDVVDWKVFSGRWS